MKLALLTILICVTTQAQSYVLSFGDSKSHRQQWQTPLIQKIAASGHLQVLWADAGNNGDSVTAAADPASPTYILTALGSLNTSNVGNNGNGITAPWTVPPLGQYPVTVVFCNWGANDVTSVPLPDQAIWQNDYIFIVDSIHARCPNAIIFLSFPWRQNYDGNCAIIHGWIDNVIAARPLYVLAGDDEAVWLKGGDNGATNTVDGVHYSAAGALADAAAKIVALGY